MGLAFLLTSERPAYMVLSPDERTTRARTALRRGTLDLLILDTGRVDAAGGHVRVNVAGETIDVQQVQNDRSG